MQFSFCKTKYLRITSIFLILYFFPQNKYFVSRKKTKKPDTADQHNGIMWYPLKSPRLGLFTVWLFVCAQTKQHTTPWQAGVTCSLLLITFSFTWAIGWDNSITIFPKHFCHPTHSAQQERTEGTILKGNSAQNILKDWESASIILFKDPCD